jgi:hypothetical protein
MAARRRDLGFVGWGASLAALLVFGLIWVCRMHNGFGFWDFMWMAAAGAAATVAGVLAAEEPWGPGLVLALAGVGAVLGFTALSGSAPALLWAAAWLLAIANGVQYGVALYREYVA